MIASIHCQNDNYYLSFVFNGVMHLDLYLMVKNLITVSLRPSNHSEMTHCDFFLFAKLKSMLNGSFFNVNIDDSKTNGT